MTSKRRREIQKKYRDAHKDQIKAYNKEYQGTGKAALNSHKWYLAHREEVLLRERKERRKNRRPCKICGKKLPFPSSGRKYCKKCYKIQERQRRLKKEHEIRDSFSDYKTAIGCQKCGYNKCAAALDFHHLNPSTKERRIEGKHWYFQTPLILNELKKCILLCKNCHYEQHAANIKNLETL